MNFLNNFLQARFIVFAAESSGILGHQRSEVLFHQLVRNGSSSVQINRGNKGFVRICEH